MKTQEMVDAFNKMVENKVLELNEAHDMLEKYGLEVRICTVCKKIMIKGYIINGGQAYYCSDECLNKHYTREQWNDMYDEEGDSYYTEWEK